MGWNFGLNWTPSIEKGPWFDGRTNLQFAIYRTGHLHKSSERQEPKRWSKSSKDHEPCNSQRWGISRMLIWVQHPIVLLKSKLYSILSALAWPGPLPTIKLTLRVWCHGPFIKSLVLFTHFCPPIPYPWTVKNTSHTNSHIIYNLSTPSFC